MKKLLKSVGEDTQGGALQGTATYGLLLVLLGSLLLNVYQLNEQNRQKDEVRLKEAFFSDQTFQLQQNLSGCQHLLLEKDSALYTLRSARSSFTPQDQNSIHSYAAHHKKKYKPRGQKI